MSDRFSIAAKLWLFFTAVTVAISAVCVFGLWRSTAILSEGRTQQDKVMDMVQTATEWNGLTRTNAARVYAILLAPGDDLEQAFKADVDSTTARISELQKSIEAMPLRDVDRAQMQKIGQLRKQMIEARTKARELKKSGDTGGAQQLLQGPFAAALAAYLGAQKEMVVLQQQRVQEVQAEIEVRRLSNVRGILLGLAVIVASIIAGTVALVRSIHGPLAQANT